MPAFGQTPPVTILTGDHGHSFGGVIPLAADVTRVPVEVISKGEPPEWVYVEVEAQAVPEPGILPLLVLAGSVLALRRRRR